MFSSYLITQTRMPILHLFRWALLM